MNARKSRSASVSGPMKTTLRTIGLLFLALCLAQPVVYARDATLPPAPPTVAAAGASEPSAGARPRWRPRAQPP